MASYELIESPVGTLFLGCSGAGIHRIDFLEQHDAPAEGSGVHALEWSVERLARDSGEDVSRGRHPLLAQAASQLREYFEGTREAFDLPLAPRGTAFQLRVWNALARIPHGETRSYGEVAEMVGRASAPRAVGAANGQNPIVIVVPCHRVVGANGTLTGYGGGLHRKTWLLDHEARSLPLFASAAARDAEVVPAS
jgi:O-6-methylguanine DNA methyltransferase